MKIIFRVDSSLKIGTGHVMRCLSLAEKMRDSGAEVEFICRQHKGNLIKKIQLNGFNVYELNLLKKSVCDNNLYHSAWLGVSQQEDAFDCIEILKTFETHWLIVDHYGLDKDWQVRLKPYCRKIMVIDDLGDRSHDCDLLLDQNLGSSEFKYHNLVGQNCKILTGPNYALLRPEFSHWREYSLKRRENKLDIDTILVSLGGVDPDNFTVKILKQLAKCNFKANIKIQVVIGESSPHSKNIQLQAARMPFSTEVKIGVNNMAELMAKADLAIGAAGSTTWERCCLGLPTIQLIISENQRQIAEVLDKIKVVKLLEKIGDIIFFIDTLDEWFYITKINCKAIVDGHGVTLVSNELNFNK